MVSSRTKLKIGSRVAIRGQIERFTEREGRPRITVIFANAPLPVTLDAMYANRPSDELRVTDEVRIEAVLERINHGQNPKWDTASIKIDGVPYPVTVPVADLEKA